MKLARSASLGSLLPSALDVFISYAHKDREFARQLRSRLEKEALEVWLDEERMVAGDPLRRELYAALQRCRQAVFVISEGWLESEWCRKELVAFDAKHGETRRKIPILRQPMGKDSLPEELRDHLWIEWFGDDDDSGGEHFERLYHALTAPLGDASPAAEDWRRAQAVRWGRGRIVWGCDRTDQWMKVETHARKRQHEALFVVGPRGEGHDFFLAAVEECYPEVPERWIRKVHWGGRLPRDKEEFLRALAESLPARSDSQATLPEALHACLRDRHLVLVHRPVIPARLSDEALMLYYTRWLPELLPEPGTTYGVLKVIQGIDWSRKPQPEGVAALERIRSGAAGGRLSVVVLPELPPLTRAHLEDWIDSLPEEIVGDPEELIGDALEGASHSADILGRLVERLCAAEETE